MLPEYQKKSNIGVGVGLVLELSGVALPMMLPSGGPAVALFSLGALGVGAVLFIWGLCSYAQAKGYSGVCGLLGLLSVIGLLILAVLPDQHKEAI